ncbi:hypothetical protein ADN00_02080 [Ornatilinea apprima]|uniref:Uncharacterized protein n=1 Tax=Ornatilinea apprima TaxID=1134406 RepID=A0A0P6YD34_9CHLR|nr:hypothetical protein ADN00_02080 [Ornatilinea apprima]
MGTGLLKQGELFFALCGRAAGKFSGQTAWIAKPMEMSKVVQTGVCSIVRHSRRKSAPQVLIISFLRQKRSGGARHKPDLVSS